MLYGDGTTVPLELWLKIIDPEEQLGFADHLKPQYKKFIGPESGYGVDGRADADGALAKKDRAAIGL